MRQSPFRIDYRGTVIVLRTHGTFLASMAIASAAVGPGFITGRETSAFFSQMKETSWLGIAWAGALFSLLVTGLAHLKSRSGANDVPALAGRLPGCAAGLLCMLHGVLLGCAGVLMTASAWQIGALTLPLRAGGIIGAAAVLLTAFLLTALPGQMQKRICAYFVLLTALYALALLAFGQLPDAAGQYLEAELKLAGSAPAAVLLGAVHACMSVCLAANAVLRFSNPSVRPWRTGFCSGGIYALLLALGNGAILRQRDFAAALSMPLTALASGWGKGGFALLAGFIFAAASTTLYVLLIPVLIPRRDCGTQRC